MDVYKDLDYDGFSQTTVEGYCAWHEAGLMSLCTQYKLDTLTVLMPRTLNAPVPTRMLRLSYRRCGLPPLTAASRNSAPNTLFLQHPLQKRSFSQSLSPRNSGLKCTKHSGDSSKLGVPDNEAHCRCCAQWRAVAVKTVQGPSVSGSPFWDATLTALMGIGFGKPVF